MFRTSDWWQRNGVLVVRAASGARGVGAMPMKFPVLELKDCELRATLGTGSFGRVRLIKHKSDNGYYALKMLKKSEVIHLKQVDHVKTEKKILEEIQHPNIVNMLGAFQDDKALYLLLDSA